MSDLARELAAMPEIVHRLLMLHVPDQDRRCRACTRPGTGIPGAGWPCALYFYADAAQQIGHQEIGRREIGRSHAVERGTR